MNLEKHTKKFLSVVDHLLNEIVFTEKKKKLGLESMNQ